MNADIVFVLDATATMGVFIDRFRREFLPEFTKQVEKIAEKDGGADVRYKFIIFRDYGSEGAAAIKQSGFYKIPEEEEKLNHEMLYIEAGGGGDSPENGLEAIYYAMKSEFAEGAGTQTIFFFTDADAVGLGERDVWSGKAPSRLTQKGKKLVIVAPENTAYSRLAGELDKTIFKPAAKSGNLNDIGLSDMFEVLGLL